jgi:hypothetical protein
MRTLGPGQKTDGNQPDSRQKWMKGTSPRMRQTVRHEHLAKAHASSHHAALPTP